MGDSIMGYHQYLQKPMNEKAKNMLNVIIDVFYIDGQQLDTKDQSFIMKSPYKIGHYSFFAPNEIQENITHSWEEHDSMAGRIAQIVTDMAEGGKGVVELLKGGTTGNKKYKLDAPLVWKNSPRREYTLPITLLNPDKPHLITGVVQDFKKMSSAKAGPHNLSAVEFPYIFRVRLHPGAMVYIESAALTGIQTTYHHPYIGGYPIKIDMTLTFLDLSPLFEHSFDEEMAKKDQIIQVGEEEPDKRVQ